MRNITPLAFLAIAALAFVAQANTSSMDPHLTPENLKTLELGKPVLVKNSAKSNSGGVKGEGVALILINLPPEQVWPHVKGYDKLPEFMPRMLTSEKYSENGDTIGVAQTLKIAWKKITYHVLQTTNDDKFEMAFHLDKSKTNDIKETTGHWLLRPHGENKTIAMYAFSVDTGMAVPQFIENFLMNRDLPGVVEAMKKRAESGGTYKKKE